MPNKVRPEDERCLLQRRRCFEELALRVFIGGIIGVYDLAGLHILTDVRRMAVLDVTGRRRAGSRGAHRRALMALESVEEHLCFTQVRAGLDDSLTSLLYTLAGLFFSMHHAASPPTMYSSAAGWTQMHMRVRIMRATPI